MARNALVTGPPRSGKTTALERTISLLREHDYAVGGIFCPELRADGERVGFEIDEIAPMELESERFVRETRRALDAPVPVLAAITYRSRDGFLGEVKSRADVERFEVTLESRDELPGELLGWARTH
ncbi:nucleoside-triphosphatase [Natronobeatus ordinarius]|uniref:nucleoside-triphosphatase n=1 Tax=Natronobeatus ordinarius TaxID=2963433 RepID=UPI0020CE011E|nr:nucleoside-triphosphatase [Natronobeatus ordinarius]